MLAPIHCSTLKHFVWKPVHENRSELFPWFKMTSNDELIADDIICDAVFVKVLSKPSCQQPEQQSLNGWQQSWHLLAEREKFAKHVMVSAGVCFGGKGWLHFFDESTEMDSAYYTGHLLPSLVDDCTWLLPSIFQQDDMPAHTELAPNKLPQFYCKRTVASKFTQLETLGLPCLGINVGGLSQVSCKTKNDRRTEGSPAGDLGQPTLGPIDKAVTEFSKRLKACVAAESRHFEHS